METLQGLAYDRHLINIYFMEEQRTNECYDCYKEEIL